jgi:hypothetical protein
MTISKLLTAAASMGAALCVYGGPAADTGARPGDDALTCAQIHAQATAETEREEEERARKREEIRAQSRAGAALLVGATLAGGLGGTGQAANAAAQAGADRSIAMLSPPPSNPRMDHLKQLWAQKRCVQK